MSEVSEKIAKILEDPESLKMITQIAESFVGNLPANTEDIESVTKNDKDMVKENDAENAKSSELSVISSAVGKLMDGGDIENTIRLVSALKPYMSHHRKESADSVLKILGMMRFVGSSEIRNIAKLFDNHEK